MRSSARCRSDDSRESRACTSGGLSTISLGRRYGRPGAEDEEWTLADNCFVIDDKGS